jgi:hypothetical protein
MIQDVFAVSQYPHLIEAIMSIDFVTVYDCSPPVTADKLLVIFIDSSFVEHVLFSM